MDVATQAINHVASNLPAQLIGDGHTGNLVASPLGLVTILSMILAGSRDRTAEQVRQVLNVRQNETEELHESFQRLLTVLDRKPGQPEESENHRWRGHHELEAYSGYDLYSKSVGFASDTIIEGYMSFLNKVYQSGMEVLKEMDPKLLMTKVNSWVNQSTYGRIDKILDNPPDPRTKLILLNSVFFSGEWQHPFKHTVKETFFNNGKDAKVVDMMNVEASFYLGADDVNDEAVRIIELPYVGSASMLLIVPENKTAVNQVVKGNLNQVMDRFDENKQMVTAKVTVPKFKVDSDLDLLDTVAALGAEDLVDYRKADLSGMTGSNIGLYLNQLKHKAQIDVNENGTVAAASTLAGFAMRGLIISELEFNVNGPFAFVIRDTVSDEILFVGKVAEL